MAADQPPAAMFNVAYAQANPKAVLPGPSIPPGAVHEPRNLIVCLDGTSNQFSMKNSNVIKLFSFIEISERQKAFYDSGVGTYVGPAMITSLQRSVASTLDLMFAWNFASHVQNAYLWLANTYKSGDQIYIFGFSRGAYCARALAGMIQSVGLLPAGMESQVPLAYKIYSRPRKPLTRVGNDGVALDPNIGTPQDYKRIFSRSESIDVHFVGVWDTVASLGVLRDENLPFASGVGSVQYFRQALALDERRAKFQPEYRHDDDTHANGVAANGSLAGSHRGSKDAQNRPYNKECWFVGAHSDCGGGNALDGDDQLSNIPFRWMMREAISVGLLVSPVALCFSPIFNIIPEAAAHIPPAFELGLSNPDVEAEVAAAATEFDLAAIKSRDIIDDAAKADAMIGPQQLSHDLAPRPQESLSPAWWPLEYLPFRRWTLSDDRQNRTRVYWPHCGAGRQMMDGQLIHRSVYDKIVNGQLNAGNRGRPYIPKTTLLDGQLWPDFVEKNKDNDHIWET